MTAMWSEAPSPSALSKLLSTTDTPQDALPLQTLHNLRYMHQWTQLSLHTVETPNAQPVTLLSGQPPHHIYIHPDKQAYMIRHNIKDVDIPVQREWVLPMALGEKWTMRRFARVFDSLPDGHEVHEQEIGSTTRVNDNMGEFTGNKSGDSHTNGQSETHAGALDNDDAQEAFSARKGAVPDIPKFGGKRILLAMVSQGIVGGDGTVVYYFMGEGEVKPRQN